jgi:hypothetical protein
LNETANRLLCYRSITTEERGALGDTPLPMRYHSITLLLATVVAFDVDGVVSIVGVVAIAVGVAAVAGTRDAVMDRVDMLLGGNRVI